MASCGSTFSNSAQVGCHNTMNHATYSCPCGSKYMTGSGLEGHIQSQQSNAKPVACGDCCKSFNSDSSLKQHQVAKTHSPPKLNPNKDCDCGRTFKSTESKNDHVRAKRIQRNFRPCLTCTKEFKTSDRLNQHKMDSGHIYKVSDDPIKRSQVYLGNHHSKATVVASDDKKRSVRAVHQRIDKILDHVRKQENGQMYGNETRNAGSYSTKTKIGKADEFDLNVPLNIREEDVEITTKGKISYKYEQPSQGGAKPRNLNVTRKVKAVKQEIPRGYTAVKFREGVDKKRFEKVEQNGYLDPRKVKEDLYGKVKEAIEDLNLKDEVNLSRDAHGPAITVTIKDADVGHYISVDISATIDKCPVPVSEYCWPRPATKETIDPKKINNVLAAGTHLVPKGDEFWYSSFSKAEKEMLQQIDSGNECRRACHKLIKKDFEKMKSESSHGYPGISTHVFRHALFWKMEDQKDWSNSYLAKRYVEYLDHTKTCVDRKKLPNYFNTSENILKGKDSEVLHDLSKALKQRKDELLHIDQ